MQLVEQTRISRTDPRFAALDRATVASKNLYNVALYETRQAYIHRGEVIAYARLARALKGHATYQALLAKVAQWVLKQVCAAWESCFQARKAYARAPSRFLGRLHNASRAVVTWLLSEQIGTVVIGYNAGWKQRVNLGRRTDQTFVQLPLRRLADMIAYKGALVGIRVIIHQESYTSKCSFFDAEPISKRPSYAGKRVKRGLFRTASGRLVNADVNAAYNQIVTVAPDAFGPGRRGAVVAPGRIALPNRQAAL